MRMICLILVCAVSACAYITLPVAADSPQQHQCVEQAPAFDPYLTPIDPSLLHAPDVDALADAGTAALDTLTPDTLTAEPADARQPSPVDLPTYSLASVPRAGPIGRPHRGHPQPVTLYRADQVVLLD